MCTKRSERQWTGDGKWNVHRPMLHHGWDEGEQRNRPFQGLFLVNFDWFWMNRWRRLWEDKMGRYSSLGSSTLRLIMCWGRLSIWWVWTVELIITAELKKTFSSKILLMIDLISLQLTMSFKLSSYHLPCHLFYHLKHVCRPLLSDRLIPHFDPSLLFDYEEELRQETPYLGLILISSYHISSHTIYHIYHLIISTIS